MKNLTKELKEGQEITGKIKQPTEEMVWNFSGGYPKGPNWPARNIHTDLEVALQCGLKTRALSAAMFVGYFSELMTDVFGENWLTSGKMDLKFIGMVDVGEKITSKAVVKSKELKGSKAIYTLDLWIEKANGEKAVVGTATAAFQ